MEVDWSFETPITRREEEAGGKMRGVGLAASAISQGKKRMVPGAWEELPFLLSAALHTSPFTTGKQNIFLRF